MPFKTIRDRVSRFGVLKPGITLALALALAALPGLSHAESIDTPVCRAHLDKIDVQLTRTLVTLDETNGQGGKSECAAMHGHIRVMLAARNVYRRCTTGSQRLEYVGQMDGSIDDVANRISINCISN